MVAMSLRKIETVLEVLAQLLINRCSSCRAEPCGNIGNRLAFVRQIPERRVLVAGFIRFVVGLQTWTSSIGHV